MTPPSADAFEEGNDLECRADFAAAVAHWELVADNRPQLAWKALLRKAQVLETQEEWTQAASAYRKSLEVAPQDAARQILFRLESLRHAESSLSDARRLQSELCVQSLAETRETITTAMAEKRPLSLIRLGDGEGTVLGFPHVFSDQALLTQLRIWLSQNQIDRLGKDLLAREIRRLVEMATASADIVGLPAYRRLQRKISSRKETPGKFTAPELNRDRNACAAVYSILGARVDLHRKIIATDFVTRDLYAETRFDFLENLDFLGVVSNHGLGETIESRYHIEQVSEYRIPGERPDSDHARNALPHYPDAFLRIESELEVPFRGAVFLVGAGVFGKHYCTLIKKRGGIAIDVGSLLDGWAKSGRPHIARNERFHL